MSFRTFIAKRYLISKKEAGFITVISVISIAGITIGVAALIVVLSVFNGFNGLVTSILIGFDPHVRVQQTEHTTPEQVARLSEMLHADPEISGMGAFVSGKAMIVSKSQSKVVFIRGLEGASIDKVAGVTKDIVLGTINFRDSTAHDMIIGMTLADRLGIVTSDTVLLVSAAGSQRGCSGLARRSSVRSASLRSMNRTTRITMHFTATCRLLLHSSCFNRAAPSTDMRSAAGISPTQKG